MTTTLDLFAVGGIVRDNLLGIPSKDVDFTCVLTDGPTLDIDAAFDAMHWIIELHGFEVFVCNPQFLTIRARVPKGHELAGWGSNTADFVLARRDGPSTDGRRPDWVTVGTLADDLARRDFTVNAMAQHAGTMSDGRFTAATGDAIFGATTDLSDLRDRVLNFVGDPMTRIREDALRVMRALRFTVAKGFTMSPATLAAILEPECVELLDRICVERRSEELKLMFKADTPATLDLLCHTITPELRAVVLAGMRLAPDLTD